MQGTTEGTSAGTQRPKAEDCEVSDTITQKDVDIWYEFMNDDGDLQEYYYYYLL